MRPYLSTATHCRPKVEVLTCHSWGRRERQLKTTSPGNCIYWFLNIVAHVVHGQSNRWKVNHPIIVQKRIEVVSRSLLGKTMCVHMSSVQMCLLVGDSSDVDDDFYAQLMQRKKLHLEKEEFLEVGGIKFWFFAVVSHCFALCVLARTCM